jgi:DNA-directed RNA polymerase subunit RPC12/RpoP
MLPTHDVHCPECGNFVYTALSLDDVLPADAPTVPKVLHDERGDYLPCPHCRARIAMKQIRIAGKPSYRPARALD